MTDIALDDDQNLFGVATSTIYLNMKVATGGVQCAQGAVKISAGSVSASNASFYGESFAPKGTLNATGEALVVGNNQGEMYLVDRDHGRPHHRRHVRHRPRERRQRQHPPVGPQERRAARLRSSR